LIGVITASHTAEKAAQHLKTVGVTRAAHDLTLRGCRPPSLETPRSRRTFSSAWPIADVPFFLGSADAERGLLRAVCFPSATPLMSRSRRVSTSI
jgi:hypothetical protein